MNQPLTGKEGFKDKNGWNYYNSTTKLSVATGKDIMLNSSGKPFTLINGNIQSKDFDTRRQYFSNSFRNWVKKNIGEATYNT